MQTKMELTIDHEHENEFPEIYELIKLAFQTSKDAEGDEEDYVNGLRKSNNYVSELAITIKDGSKIIGHIMLTRTLIKIAAENFDALLLSPVCVQLEYRNKGLASLLIKQALTKAKGKGFKAVFLVGDPDYYCRFGFRPISEFGIKDTGNIPVQFTMGLELENGYLDKNGGIISIL